MLNFETFHLYHNNTFQTYHFYKQKTTKSISIRNRFTLIYVYDNIIIATLPNFIQNDKVS